MGNQPLGNGLRTDFWLKQLDLAHERNALVDNHRFRALQMLLAFHTLVLGALVFRGKGTSPPTFGGWIPTFIGAGVLLIGLSLFGALLSQHWYMLRYKRWAKELEGLIREAAGLLRDGETNPHSPAHSGSLYQDENPPDRGKLRARDTTLLAMTACIILVNCVVPFLAAYVLGASASRAAWLFSLGFVAQAFSVIVFLGLTRPQRHA